MTPSTNQAQKRKGPPEFCHLPAERAKKLKREWVEKQKIKSKWKAQKRKESGAAPKPMEHPESEADSSSDESPAHQSQPKPVSEPKPKSPKPVPEKTQSQADTPTNQKIPWAKKRTARTQQHRQRKTQGALHGKARQLDMKSKMVNLLEKIQKTHSSN